MSKKQSIYKTVKKKKTQNKIFSLLLFWIYVTYFLETCMAKNEIAILYFENLTFSNILKYEDNIVGHIVSPGYSMEYPNNSNYRWVMRSGNTLANVSFSVLK